MLRVITLLWRLPIFVALCKKEYCWVSATGPMFCSAGGAGSGSAGIP